MITLQQSLQVLARERGVWCSKFNKQTRLSCDYPPTFFFWVQGPGDNIVIRVAQITPDLVARFRGCRKAGISWLLRL